MPSGCTLARSRGAFDGPGAMGGARRRRRVAGRAHGGAHAGVRWPPVHRSDGSIRTRHQDWAARAPIAAAGGVDNGGSDRACLMFGRVRPANERLRINECLGKRARLKGTGGPRTCNLRPRQAWPLLASGLPNWVFWRLYLTIHPGANVYHPAVRRRPDGAGSAARPPPASYQHSEPLYGLLARQRCAQRDTRRPRIGKARPPVARRPAVTRRAGPPNMTRDSRAVAPNPQLVPSI
jgi:hypothetical protein